MLFMYTDIGVPERRPTIPLSASAMEMPASKRVVMQTAFSFTGKFNGITTVQ